MLVKQTVEKIHIKARENEVSWLRTFAREFSRFFLIFFGSYITSLDSVINDIVWAVSCVVIQPV